MKKCKHKNITTTNVLMGGYYTPVGTVEEYDIVCKDCGEWLAHWSYGIITDFSKDGEKILSFKIPFYRKIFDYIKNKMQNRKIDIYNNQELPF